jgi:hypothetical protein
MWKSTSGSDDDGQSTQPETCPEAAALAWRQSLLLILLLLESMLTPGERGTPM